MITQVSNRPGAWLNGVSVSSGMYLGIARVVQNDEDIRAALPGEIIVARELLTGLEGRMPFAGAIIAEAEDVLAKGAMLAREFGVPAIAAVADATSRISSGDELLVDGAAGKVIFIRSARS